ncbi:MAG: PAS domain-containing protein [Alphaproteobacteria bacterium]|nr:PAS domain-containing protein [Alphaproteobacteria bacterium]
MLRADHIQQLANKWLEARGDQLMPKASQFGPFELRPFLPNIAVYRKTPESRYKVTLQGTGLVEAFGFDATGMFLDDVYPADVFVELNALYKLLFDNQYVSHSVRVYERKGTGALVTIEQIMVPVSNEDGQHDRYVLLAYNVPLPQRPRSDPNRTIALGSLEERTVYHPETLLPVECFATTPRDDTQMREALTAFRAN